jgi:hypothetical protein
MRMDLEMNNTSNSDYTHCTIVVSLEMSDEPYFLLSPEKRKAFILRWAQDKGVEDWAVFRFMKYSN